MSRVRKDVLLQAAYDYLVGLMYHAPDNMSLKVQFDGDFRNGHELLEEIRVELLRIESKEKVCG